MSKNPLLRCPVGHCLLAGLFLFVLQAPGAASVIVTYAESPQEQSSQIPNTQAFDFNSLPLGVNTNVAWPGVGVFDQLYIRSASIFGGAPNSSNPAQNSPYMVAGNNSSGITTTTLTLLNPMAYFGFWWSAADPYNQLLFYSNSTLVAEFTTTNLMAQLPARYDGNPTAPYLGKNAKQAYGYINFFGSAGVTWTSIALTDTGATGFEGDNFAVATPAWTSSQSQMPGIQLEQSQLIGGQQVITPLPEPGSLMLVAVAGSLLWTFRQRQRKFQMGA